MSKDKNKIQTIEIVFATLLIACTLLKLTKYKYFTAILLAITAIIISYFMKKNPPIKANKKKIEQTMIVFGILYIALYYTLGIYTGFYKQSEFLSIKTITIYIIPITIIIYSTEVIRNKLLLNDSKKSKILITIIGTIIDLSIYLDIYGFYTLDGFLALLGFVTFTAIANNLLANYISIQYGKNSVILYRLLTTLYIYLIPVTPNVYIYFRTFVRMIYPLFIYSYIDNNYRINKKIENIKDRKAQTLSLSIGLITITLIIALISCKFLYGVLVIGSESMTGSIDKGDVILFKSKTDKIQEGDVIVFEKENRKIVHRVTNVKNINKKFRYYTKGDANPIPDKDYVSKEELVGKVLFRVRYIGKPTLWLRNIFDKEG